MRPTGALLLACHKPVGEAYAARRAATSETQTRWQCNWECLGWLQHARDEVQIKIERESNIDALHGFLRIARAGGRSERRGAVQARKIGGRQFHLQSAKVLLEVTPPFRARDGDNIFAAGQEPGQR